MKVKAFSLIESLVALSILAFVTAASVYQIGRLYASAQTDMGAVYQAVKALENQHGPAASFVEQGSFTVERTSEKYSAELDLCTVTAKHRTGQTLLQIRKLIPHEKE